MEQDRMEAFQGEEWDGKDATFQGAGGPQPIPTGKHNGHIRRNVCTTLDHRAHLTQGAMQDPSAQCILRACGHQRGRTRKLHQRQSGTVRVHGPGAHVDAG